MEGLDVREVALGGALEREVGVRAANLDRDAAPVESRQRVFQADPELADDQVGLASLLGVFVLGQMLVTQATPEVGDMPSVAALEDLGLRRAAERLLVEGVGDHLSDGFGHAPVVQDLFDVEVEKRHLPLDCQGLARYLT